MVIKWSWMSERYRPCQVQHQLFSKLFSERTAGRTISDLGAMLQFSLHLFARPFTTSALLPMSRKRPMTFLRHVPILYSYPSAHLPGCRMGRSPSQHIGLFRVFEDQYQLIDTVDFVLDALNQWSKCIGDVVDERVRDPIRCDGDVILELLDAPTDILRVGRRSKMELPTDQSIVSTRSTPKYGDERKGMHR